jgi:serine/threonine protein kinase
MTAQPWLSGGPLAQRYWPVRLLAVGGMAEIHLARQGEPDPAGVGFHKELVIKRLKPELVGDPRVAGLFLDEARLGGLFNHPHVVQVYDVGEEDAAPFIAMEFIRGAELNDVCRRGLAGHRFLPLEHAAELMRQAATALGYVHALRDADGRSLDIVHCDVSPTNLLITEDGFLKLIDFGIARARGQRRRDQQALPGKPSYMSPEQARRAELDHRSDIFSLGVVLYEITVGRRLFRGPAHEVLRRLRRCEVRPPTFVRRDFPAALESIIMRALEPVPGDRYATAYDMADDLDEFLRESGSRTGSLRVARYLDELAVAVGGERRSELVSEREQRGDEEALDFDRGVFDGYRPETDRASGEWDEYEEDEQAVADALGVDVAAMRMAAAGTSSDGAGRPRRRTTTQTGDRRPATGNRQPASSRPVAGHRLPTADPVSPASLAASPVADNPAPERHVIGSPGIGRHATFALGAVAGVLAFLLLRFLLG